MSKKSGQRSASSAGPGRRSAQPVKARSVNAKTPKSAKRPKTGRSGSTTTKKGARVKSPSTTQPPAPKPARVIELIARGVLIHEGRVLLCQNLKHGHYFLPGGHVDFGESAEAALRREFLEETGLAVRVGAAALFSEGVFQAADGQHHEVNLVFHVEPSDPAQDLRALASREKHLGFAFVDLGVVPDLDLRPLAAKAWLSTLSDGQMPPEWVSDVPV